MSFEKVFIKDIDSTQTYLIDLVKTQKVDKNFVVYSNKQSNGIGSRGNRWDSLEGNLYMSFVLCLDDLPSDLKLSSSSIYFMYLAKLAFAKFDKYPWVKWPNDLYENNMKLGGMITSKVGNAIVCGVGINFKNPPCGAFGYNDVDMEDFLDEYIKVIEMKISWKDIFCKYVNDFEKTRSFYCNLGDKKVSLKDAFLYQDGSILLENQRIYSLR